MKKILTVFFDGDDTLWKTQEIYDEVKKQFLVLLENAGIKDENIIEKLDDIDVKRVPIRGFTVERFLESMLITYTIYSTAQSIPWNVEVEENIYKIGLLLKQPPSLYEDTLPALNALKSKSQLFLYSAGKQSVQMQKLTGVGVAQYFKEVYIVPSKDSETLKKILAENGLESSDVWLVGNSLRSDILPAIGAGVKAILVERGVWKYDKSVSQQENHEQYFRAHSLKEAASLILN
jgi:putative hydrolase of the HAD superfamily